MKNIYASAKIISTQSKLTTQIKEEVINEGPISSLVTGAAKLGKKIYDVATKGKGATLDALETERKAAEAAAALAKTKRTAAAKDAAKKLEKEAQAIASKEQQLQSKMSTADINARQVAKDVAKEVQDKTPALLKPKAVAPKAAPPRYDASAATKKALGVAAGTTAATLGGLALVPEKPKEQKTPKPEEPVRIQLMPPEVQQKTEPSQKRVDQAAKISEPELKKIDQTANITEPKTDAAPSVVKVSPKPSKPNVSSPVSSVPKVQLDLPSQNKNTIQPMDDAPAVAKVAPTPSKPDVFAPVPGTPKLQLDTLKQDTKITAPVDSTPAVAKPAQKPSIKVSDKLPKLANKIPSSLLKHEPKVLKPELGMVSGTPSIKAPAEKSKDVFKAPAGTPNLEVGKVANIDLAPLSQTANVSVSGVDRPVAVQPAKQTQKGATPTSSGKPSKVDAGRVTVPTVGDNKIVDVDTTSVIGAKSTASAAKAPTVSPQAAAPKVSVTRSSVNVTVGTGAKQSDGIRPTGTPSATATGTDAVKPAPTVAKTTTVAPQKISTGISPATQKDKSDSGKQFSIKNVELDEPPKPVAAVVGKETDTISKPEPKPETEVKRVVEPPKAKEKEQKSSIASPSITLPEPKVQGIRTPGSDKPGVTTFLKSRFGKNTIVKPGIQESTQEGKKMSINKKFNISDSLYNSVMEVLQKSLSEQPLPAEAGLGDVTPNVTTRPMRPSSVARPMPKPIVRKASPLPPEAGLGDETTGIITTQEKPSFSQQEVKRIQQNRYDNSVMRNGKVTAPAMRKEETEKEFPEFPLSKFTPPKVLSTHKTEDGKTIKVHDMSHLDHEDAYDETQTNDNIKDGDVLKVKNGTAFLYKAWPVMVDGNSDVFHKMKNIEKFQSDNKYRHSLNIAKNLSENYKLEEGLKLVSTHSNDDGSRMAKVYRDTEWEEFRVKHYENGAHLKNADYHDSHKESVTSHAKNWVNKTNEETDLEESRYSKGEDVGKKGLNFKKIAKKAGKKYGSEEAGKRVAGSILKKILRKKKVNEAEEKSLKDACWKGYEAIGTKKKNGKEVPNCVPIKEEKNEGKKLNKPFLTPGGPKKRAVYVKNEKGNVVKVNFGDPNLEIKRDNPERRKNFRARHNCDNPGPKTKAKYWSCKYWSTKSVSDLDKE